MVPALRLGESAGLYDLLEEALTVNSPNATAKTTCVVGGMLADAGNVGGWVADALGSGGQVADALDQAARSRTRSIRRTRSAWVAASGVTLSVVTPDSFSAASRSAT